MDPRRNIAHGFLWLGSSSLVSSLVDSASTIAVLWFMTREDVGTATVAWSIAVVVEAFNGLGIGTALVQARSLSDQQVSSVFWYSVGIAVLATLGIAVTSPWIAAAYGSAALAPMIIVSASKLVAVGSALVPLQMLHRELRWKEVSSIGALATLLSALLRVTLAALGFGAWALVLAHAAHGVFVAAGAFLLSSFRPRLTFAFGAIRGMASFGLQVASSGVIYHFYRNADFLLIGRFLGLDALGMYRVAFDLAMTPAATLLQTVGRAAFPVFARLSHDPPELARVFSFTLRTLSLIVLGVLAIVAASASDLLLVLGQGQWARAAPAVVLLSGAAFLRALAQIFPQLFHAAGRPLYALYDSLFSACVLVGAFALAASRFPGERGILAVSWAWLLSYPILLAALLALTARIVPLSLSQVLRSLLPALGGGALLAAWFWPFTALTTRVHSPLLRLALIASSGVVVYLAYLRYGLRLSPSMLLRQPARRTDSSDHGSSAVTTPKSDQAATGSE